MRLLIFIFILVGKMSVSASEIILEAPEEKTVEEITKFKQSGLTVQISHPVISAVQTLNALNNNLKDVDDTHKNRMSAVAAGAAALSLKNNYDAFNNSILAGRSDAGIKNAASNSVANASNKMGGLNISVTLGMNKNTSHITTTESLSRGSSVSASGNAYIQSTQGDITIQGSSVKAGNNLTLDAARNLNILASKDTRETIAKRRNEEGSVGLNFGSRGIGVSFSGGAGRGVGEGEDVFYNQSYVTAGNTLTLLSGGDTNIIGGIVSGDKVRAKIGGDLHIESVQDIERSKSRDYGGGATVTIGYGWFTVTGHGNYDAFNNDYKSVKQQSGIFAGDQGFDVTVKGNTNLIGAVIAGSQKSINDGVNQLTTGTLTTSDLKNKAKYDACQAQSQKCADILGSLIGIYIDSSDKGAYQNEVAISKILKTYGVLELSGNDIFMQNLVTAAIGSMDVANGVGMATIGSALIASKNPYAAGFGAVLIAIGADYTATGLRTFMLDGQQYTLGSQFISEVSGMSLQDAEYAYTLLTTAASASGANAGLKQQLAPYIAYLEQSKKVGYLEKPVTDGVLNIGAGNKPKLGAYNISHPDYPMANGVYPGDAMNLSNISTGSQRVIIMENPQVVVFNAETLRVLARGGTIEVTGTTLRAC